MIRRQSCPASASVQDVTLAAYLARCQCLQYYSCNNVQKHLGRERELKREIVEHIAFDPKSRKTGGLAVFLHDVLSPGSWVCCCLQRSELFQSIYRRVGVTQSTLGHFTSESLSQQPQAQTSCKEIRGQWGDGIKAE
eukprot:6365831-Amphidinium_carterae.1